MKPDLHCMLCGGVLARGGEYTACNHCGAEYSNVLVSESIPFDECKPIEVSISMEGMFVNKKTQVSVPVRIQPAIEESIAL